MSFLRTLFGGNEEEVPVVLAGTCVTPDATRCVQCGICSYNCPVGIDVRAYAFRGLPVKDSTCIACGICIERCPRNTLQFAVPEEDRFFQPAWEKDPFEQVEAYGLLEALVKTGA